MTCKSSHADVVIPEAEACPIGPLASGNSYDFTIKALAAGEAVIEGEQPYRNEEPGRRILIGRSFWARAAIAQGMIESIVCRPIAGATSS